ncbi:short-chain dehydrogenase reductase 2a [Rosa sericea]
MPAVMPETPLHGIHGLGRDNSTTTPSHPRRLEGKVAIVTGGARGIGEATARLFTRHGAKVVIADVEDSIGTTLANSLGPSVTFVHCDVSLEEDIENLIESTVSRYGQLDIMFNNAGILGNQSKHKSIVNFDVDEFDRVMRVNVRGTALGIKHAARVMIPRGGGCIISTASVAGVAGRARAACLHSFQACHCWADEERRL